jgi:hypothetical protein
MILLHEIENGEELFHGDVLLLAAVQRLLMRAESSKQGQTGGLFFLATVDNGDESPLGLHPTVGWSRDLI